MKLTVASLLLSQPWQVVAQPGGSPTAENKATTTTTPKKVRESRWIAGTWTTGYWDCCKPSCSWAGKGIVTRPARSCDAMTGKTLLDPNVRSVCQGGVSAMCADHTPFVINETLSMGFAAAAVGGFHGLAGDSDCGRCFEVQFTGEVHNNGNWGGSHPELVGKTMVLQVNNIGYDVSGDHSFDIQIPGAGQGAFADGCRTQFRGYDVGDFDCNNRYGGCYEKGGCENLPKNLREGCRWRFEWYMWMASMGRTNNPYVKFRRVRCPEELTSVSGSIPLDDEEWPAVAIEYPSTNTTTTTSTTSTTSTTTTTTTTA